MYQLCLVHRKCAVQCCLSSGTSELHSTWQPALVTRLGWPIGSTPMDPDTRREIHMLYPRNLQWQHRFWTGIIGWLMSDGLNNWSLLTWTKYLRALESTFSISVKFLIVSQLRSAQLELKPFNCLLIIHLGSKPSIAVSVYSKSARVLNGAHGRSSGWGIYTGWFEWEWLAFTAIIFTVGSGEWGWGISLMYSCGKLGPNMATGSIILANIRRDISSLGKRKHTIKTLSCVLRVQLW